VSTSTINRERRTRKGIVGKEEWGSKKFGGRVYNREGIKVNNVMEISSYADISR